MGQPSPKDNNGNGPNPLDFRREFDKGPGSEPLERTSAAYNKFAYHIQHLAERTQAIVNHLEWEALAAERAQQAVAAFYLSMQQYAEVAQAAAVAAQSGAGAYTQANQGQMTQEILTLILLALAFYMATQHLEGVIQKTAEFAIGGMMAFEAVQLLTNSAQQASSLAPASPVSPLTASPQSAGAGNSGDSSDSLSNLLPSLLSSLATAAPLAALAAQNLAPHGDPPPPPGGAGGGGGPDDAGSLESTPTDSGIVLPGGLPAVAGVFPFGPDAQEKVAAQTSGMPIGGMPAGAPGGGGGGGSSRKKNATTADNTDIKPAALPGVLAGEDPDDDGFYYDAARATAQKWSEPARNA